MITYTYRIYSIRYQ